MGNTHRLPSIDKDKFPDKSDQGLEGPFIYRNGRVLYHDPKEGKYYDSLTDMFVDNDEITQMMQSGAM